MHTFLHFQRVFLNAHGLYSGLENVSCMYAGSAASNHMPLQIGGSGASYLATVDIRALQSDLPHQGSW